MAFGTYTKDWSWPMEEPCLLILFLFQAADFGCVRGFPSADEGDSEHHDAASRYHLYDIAMPLAPILILGGKFVLIPSRSPTDWG